jgi:serine/threonine protein kinase
MVIAVGLLPSSQGEAELLMRLHHPNIVKFYGYVKTRHFLVAPILPLDHSDVG